MKRIVVALVLLATFAGIGKSEIVYKPILPTFGGNPFAASHLMAVANVSKPQIPRKKRTFADDLKSSLERQFSSGLTSFFRKQFFQGTDIEAGTFDLGDFIAEVIPSETEILIVITDKATGAVTEISVPRPPITAQAPALSTPSFAMAPTLAVKLADLKQLDPKGDMQPPAGFNVPKRALPVQLPALQAQTVLQRVDGGIVRIPQIP